jgi:hypothetical protein
MLPRISNNNVTIARTTCTSTASTITSGWVNMKDYQEILAKINTGAVATSVDAQLVQATDNTGTGSKAVTGKSITQITSADQYVEIELQQDECKTAMDLDNGFYFVALEITIVGVSFASGEIVTTYQSDEDNVPTDTVADELVRRTIS